MRIESKKNLFNQSVLRALTLIGVSTHFLMSYATAEEVVFTFDTIHVNADAIDLNATSATTATKSDLPLIDTPQSITVIPEELIEEQQADTVGDVLKNDASITNQGHFGAHEIFNARGFVLDGTGNFLFNGRVFRNFAVPPIEALERVEVLKGPAAVLYGQGAPGATINFVTKQPTPFPYYSIDLGIGSWDYYRAHVDASGPLDPGERAHFRTNVVYLESDSFRDHVFVERAVATTAATWAVSDTARLRFDLNLDRNEQPQDTGLVAINGKVADLSRSTQLNPDWTTNDVESILGSVQLDWALTPLWFLEASGAYQYYSRERLISFVTQIDNDSGDFTYQYQHRDDRWQLYTTQADLFTERSWLGTEHQLLFGSNYIFIDHDQTESQRYTDPNHYNIYQPIDFIALSDIHFTYKPSENNQEHRLGVYAQDVMSVGKYWEVIVGGRYDYFAASTPDVSHYDSDSVVGKAGIVFHPWSFVSLYGNFAQSFEPNAPVTDDVVNKGDALKPTTGEQFEVGLKGEWMQGRLATSLALFYIKVRDIPMQEEIDDGEFEVVQRGEQLHKGLEASVIGRLLPGWQIFSSLMLLDARITEDTDPNVEGNRPPGAPVFSASLWSYYQLPFTWSQGVSVNAGVFYESERKGDAQNSFVLDPYTRIDAGASYRRPLGEYHLTVRLLVENIFDESYFQSYRETNVTVGTPRQFRLSAQLEF